MKIETIQAELIDEFSMFDDWMERYEYMIELGKSLPIIDSKYKTEDNIIKGCQSKVWLHADLENEKVCFLPIVMPSSQRNCCHFDSGFFKPKS